MNKSIKEHPMDKCKRCSGPMDQVPDHFTPQIQCRVCRDIVYLTRDGQEFKGPIIRNGAGARSIRYEDVRRQVERLIDAGYETAQISGIIDVPRDTIYRGSRDYRIKTGKFSFHKSRMMARG